MDPINLLPYDGEVFYIKSFLSSDLSKRYFDELFSKINWEHDEYQMFGKQIFTKRKVAWYGSKPYLYKYSKLTRSARPWINPLEDLKMRAEKKAKTSFNTCLLNLYHNGSEGMSWHSDDEKELKPQGAIASISLGAKRRFSFKHKKTKEKLDLVLEDGSLMLMLGKTQELWLHQLPKSARVKSPRINLTFRTILS